MANPNTIIADAQGLQTQSNELTLPPGSLTVAENVEITRDGVIEVARGFENFSSNLPDFKPSQILSVGGVAYAIVDGGLWYHDGTNWLRKRGSLGSKNPQPNAVVCLNGHLYVGSNNTLYDVNLATGARSVLAGRFGTNGDTDGTGDAARFYQITGLCTDGTNLYASISSRHTVRQIVIATGAVTTLAGSAGSSGTADAVGASARFNTPVGLAVVGSSLYVCDSQNHSVRKIEVASGLVTTFAGLSGTAGNSDGTGTAARLTGPWAIASNENNLYISTASVTNQFRQITVPGAVVATSGGNSGGATAPQCMALIGGVMYFGDFDSKVIRQVTLSTGAQVIFAGANGSSGTTDGIGTAARFADPEGMATDGVDLYVADATSYSIRKIYVGSAYVTTITGTPGQVAASNGAALIDGAVVGPS